MTLIAILAWTLLSLLMVSIATTATIALLWLETVYRLKQCKKDSATHPDRGIKES